VFLLLLFVSFYKFQEPCDFQIADVDDVSASVFGQDEETDRANVNKGKFILELFRYMAGLFLLVLHVYFRCL
jgi:hypothetical protein